MKNNSIPSASPSTSDKTSKPSLLERLKATITSTAGKTCLTLTLSTGVAAAVYNTCGDEIKDTFIEALEKEAAFDRAVLQPYIEAAQEAEYLEQREAEIARQNAEENKKAVEAFITPYAQHFIHTAVNNALQHADMEGRAITGYIHQPVGD